MAEHPAGHLVLKWLIEQDVKMKELGKTGRGNHIDFNVCCLELVESFLHQTEMLLFWTVHFPIENILDGDRWERAFQRICL